jgi:hypothetical protein
MPVVVLAFGVLRTNQARLAALSRRCRLGTANYGAGAWLKQMKRISPAAEIARKRRPPILKTVG